MEEKKCYNCGATGRTVRPYVHEIIIDGLPTQSRPRPKLHCDGCGDVTFTLAELQEFERAAAAAVLCGPVPASREMVRYARRAIGISRQELAQELHCEESKVTAWEKGDEQIDLCSQLALITLLIPSEVA